MERYLKTEDEKWKEYAESQAKPTCVVDTSAGKQLQSDVPPVLTVPFIPPDFDWWKTPVYLTSQQGFDNYCKGCEKLLKSENTGRNMIAVRVICSVERCVKP